MKIKIIDDRPVIIDIGSGPHPKRDATVRMDIHRWVGDEVLHDLNFLPYPFVDDYADKIYLGDVIEHIVYLNAEPLLKEILRILKPGGLLEITCPDLLWVMTRIVNDDWNEMANVDWLRKHDDPWDNAMDYIFGGWRHSEEYKIAGMGHINGFSEVSLSNMLREAGFSKVIRVPDERNPEPARGAVLKLLAWK